MPLANSDEGSFPPRYCVLRACIISQKGQPLLGNNSLAFPIDRIHLRATFIPQLAEHIAVHIQPCANVAEFSTMFSGSMYCLRVTYWRQKDGKVPGNQKNLQLVWWGKKTNIHWN